MLNQYEIFELNQEIFDNTIQIFLRKGNLMTYNLIKNSVESTQ